MRTEHLDSQTATMKAMEEVTRPVIAIVLVLTAVFLPVAFLGGLVGEMYRQFAVTISVSVVISGFVALTLTPALCALMLRHEDRQEHRILRRFNDWFARMTDRYEQGVRFVMKRGALAAGVFGVMLLATFGLFRTVPTSLAPTEDQGYVFVIGMLQDAASLRRTTAAFDAVTEDVRRHPAVANAMSVSGMDPLSFSFKTNAGLVWVPLKPWDERTGDDSKSPGAVVQAVMQAGSKVKDAFFFAVEPPPIEGLSNVGGFELYIQSRGRGTPQELADVVQKFVGAAAQRKELKDVQTTFSAACRRCASIWTARRR